MRLGAIAKKFLSRQRLKPAPPFPVSEQSPSAVQERIEQCRNDFWAFDKIYFPPSVYTQGYAPPADFHRELADIATMGGLHVVLAPRDHGKTVTLKKFEVWLQLYGHVEVSGTMSENLTKAGNILSDLRVLIQDNPRIYHDFRPVFSQANTHQYQFRTESPHLPPHVRTCMAFSGKRSARGSGKLFSRPDRIFCDDLETRQSPLSDEQADRRIRTLSEAAKSTKLGGTVIVIGNNFDEKTAVNRLLIEQDRGIIQEGYRVHVYRAWNGEPLWPQRFPAKTETELRKMLKPYDTAEWLGDYQQEPAKPEGITFRREFYQEWAELPPDTRGVIYCDPNLSKKGRGDTTAIIALGWSVSQLKYFAVRAVCRSFSDPNELLLEVLRIREETGFRQVGFDGNVSQESSWTAHVRNFATINKFPLPSIQYKRYKIDDLTKNAQTAWVNGEILFPRGFAESRSGRKFMDQVFSFAGKKAGKLDDAPDALISAIEMISETGLKRVLKNKPKIEPIADVFNF